MASPARWFPTVSNGITPPLQQIFQRVLTYVYGNQTNIAGLQAQIASFQSPTATFPAHFNTLGTPRLMRTTRDRTSSCAMPRICG